jgi:hypothetical protein
MSCGNCDGLDKKKVQIVCTALDSLIQDLLDDVLTYDTVAKRMQEMDFQPNKCELGEVMCAIRALVRKSLQGEKG